MNFIQTAAAGSSQKVPSTLIGLKLNNKRILETFDVYNYYSYCLPIGTHLAWSDQPIQRVGLAITEKYWLVVCDNEVLIIIDTKVKFKIYEKLEQN